MVSSKIQLRKIRNLSDCINDVIQFIKQEFKPLMRGFLIICGFFILLSAIFSGIYSSVGSYDVWKSIFNGGSYSEGYAYSRIFNPSYYLVIIFSFLTQASIYTYIACYLKVYEEKNGVSPTIEELWAKFKQNIFPLFGYLLLITFISALGLCFCIAPGVYLGTVFAPFGFIIVMDKEKQSGSVINTCFTIIKDNFWPSLGVYIICGLIYYMCSGIIGLIVGGSTALISYFTTGNLSYVIGIISGVLSILGVVFSIIFYLGIGMQYFNLEERQNGTGLMNRIEDMGNSANENSYLNTNE